MAYTSDSIENIIKSLTIGGKTYPLGVQYADNADKADSMNVSKAIGNSKRPIYLKADGTFAQTTYSLGKTVPSNAVFTDTTYQLTLNGTTNGAGTTDLGTIYAPTSAGTSGQYLVSNGSGAPTWADFSSLLSPYVTKQNLEAYGNWITIFANELNHYDVGFKVLSETTGRSTIVDSDGIYLYDGRTSAIISFGNNELYLGPYTCDIDGDLNIGNDLHLGAASADVTISTEVDGDNKTTIIGSKLEIGDELIFSKEDNSVEHATISTEAGGDLMFSGLAFEFDNTSADFIVNGPVYLKGEKNTGSATNPIYIDANGQFQPITYTLGASVPSTAKFTDTTYKLTLNGTTKGGGSTNLGTIYAPTSAGTSGQYLKSNGSGAPTWADFSSLLSPYVTKQNLEAYGNWITIFANTSNDYAGFKVLDESNSASWAAMDFDGIHMNRGSNSANMTFVNNTLRVEAQNIAFNTQNPTFSGDLNIGNDLHLGASSANVTISTDVDHINADNGIVTTIDSRLKVDNTIYLSTNQSDYVSISTSAHTADPSIVKTLFIDSDLEIGSTLYLSDNQIDYASIWTDGGGDLFFSGTNFEFALSGNFTVLGPISLKGAKNTGSSSRPVYIDNLGKFRPINYDIGDLVNQISQLQNRISQLESIITSYIGPIN